LKKNDTFQTVYKKIKTDVEKRSCIFGWKNKDNTYNSMKIDYDQKAETKNIQQNNNKNKHDFINNKNNRNKKYCTICNIRNHYTSECWYNIKNKNSKYHKYLLNDYRNNNSINNKNNNDNKNNSNYNKYNKSRTNNKDAFGKIFKYDINNIYNANVSYHEIRAMFFDSEDETFKSNSKYSKVKNRDYNRYYNK